METPLEQFADNIFQTLAAFFPVCLSSDEFHFFPQIKATHHDWARWDNFSADAVQEITRKLSAWERSLFSIEERTTDADILIDISMLTRMMATVREQLDRVRPHETQPTWYLTIAGIGLAEALESGASAWHLRIKTLPGFLDHARDNLLMIPDLFRASGLEMVDKLKLWLMSPTFSKTDLVLVFEALERFKQHLENCPAKKSFLLPFDLVNRMIQSHLGCDTDLEAVLEELDLEIEETSALLTREAGKMESSRNPAALSWLDAVDAMPVPLLPDDGLTGLYGLAIRNLGDHCQSIGLTTRQGLTSCPVTVEPVPSYLATIRSAAAYSMPPGHPPKGGTFYIDGPGSSAAPPLDYFLLAAHETYPGHHLLDTARWSLKRRLRRHMEFPLFYEGWACFAEELMFHTGFFNGSAARLLLARRRFFRALRGKADLEMHAGKKDLSRAASLLTLAGEPMDQALSMVRRYALKPGYQVCYTIGMRRFRTLYEQFISNNQPPADFANQVFNLGEIGLDQMKKCLAGGQP